MVVVPPFFQWCVVFVCVCVFDVFVSFRCNLMCDVARSDFGCVCCLCVSVRWFVYVCGVSEVLGDFVFFMVCALEMCVCCVCVCVFLCVCCF